MMARRKAKRKSTTRAPVKRASSSGKKQLTEDQEFKIMLLVLDKFLWLGFGIMAVGLFMIVSASQDLYRGTSFMVAGALLLVIFMILIVKEYEILK